MSDIEGGCACGAVRFRLTAPPMGVGVCHCRSCQYGTGGGPNYVALAMKPAFEITKGAPRIYTSKAESGNDVSRAFCAECGTPLYTITGDGAPFYPVKLGALDDPSGFQPVLHLYMEDAQPWHLTHDGLPQFPKMPPAPPA